MIATSSAAGGRPGRAKLSAAVRASSYAAVASWDLYPAPRWTPEYQGTNASTAATTWPSALVDVAASNDRYGRSVPSTQGTGVRSPTSGTGGAGARGGGSEPRAHAAAWACSGSLPPGRSGESDVTMAGLPKEVLLEGELHGVRLRPGDEQTVLARRQHPVGQNDHAVVACVHHTHRRHVAERLLVGRCLAPDLRRDVPRRHVSHPLGGETGLGNAHRGGCLPRHVDGGGDADRVDLVVTDRLVGVADFHVALVVGDLARGPDDLLANERRHDHGVGEADLSAVGQHEPPGVDVVHAGAQDRGDVLLLQEHGQQCLAVRQPADAEVPQKRLGRDVGQLDLPLQAGLAELVRDVEQVLVGGAEAAGALGCADDDVAWRFKEPLPALTGPDRVVQGGDRVRVTARPQARHGCEIVTVPGRYHQVVVVVAAPGR